MPQALKEAGLYIGLPIGLTIGTIIIMVIMMILNKNTSNFIYFSFGGIIYTWIVYGLIRLFGGN